MDPCTFPILPIDLYLEIEKQREEILMKNIMSGLDLNLESSIV